MSQTVAINITTGGTVAAQTITDIFKKPTSAPRSEMESVLNYLNGAVGGLNPCSIDVQVNGGVSVAASGTIIFSDVSTANDTIVVNGTTFTAVASGATGNQWNVKSTAALQATEVARALNASATALVSGLISAAKTSTATVTITALLKGVTGNAITIAKGVDAGSVMTVSGARLTGGVAITANVYHYGA